MCIYYGFFDADVFYAVMQKYLQVITKKIRWRTMCVWAKTEEAQCSRVSSTGLWAPQEASDVAAAGEGRGGPARSQPGLPTVGF